MSNDRTAPDSRQAPPTDVSDLLAKIEELRRVAERLGQGTLAFFLDCAGIEASAQARLQKEQGAFAAQPVQRNDVRI